MTTTSDIIKRIDEVILASDWLQHHGCFTGDCPHDDVNDCILALRKTAEEEAKDVWIAQSLKIAMEALDKACRCDKTLLVKGCRTCQALEKIKGLAK